ncbi:MAG: PQQ-binding-like beta-propeller repeat protein, partial [Pseudonocardiaceae bacterium]
VKLPATALRSNLAGDVTSRFTTLVGRTAYIVDPTSLNAVDVLTGKTKWQVPTEGVPGDPNAQKGPFVSSTGPRPPKLSTDGKTVVAAVPITVPGQGTTPAHQAASVLAANVKTGKKAWSTTVDISDKASGGDGSGAVTSVVTATDKAVVVTYDTATASIDPSNRKVLWQRDDYQAGAVNGDTVLGADSNVAENSSMLQATALDLVTGKQRWVAATRSSSVEVIPSHPNLFLLGRNDYGNGDSNLLFLDTNTGKEQVNVFKNRPFGLGYGLTPCDYDQRSVVVCHPDNVVADDATNGKQLWSLPDTAANRIAPSVRTVWHGALYGNTPNGPVVLDAKTGKDRSAAPGAAPFWVSEYAGIGLDSQGVPVAYPIKE